MKKKDFWLPTRPPFPERRRQQLLAKIHDSLVDLVIGVAIMAAVALVLHRTYRHYYPKEIHVHLQGHS